MTLNPPVSVPGFYQGFWPYSDQYNETANYTIPDSQNGALFTNLGATGSVNFTLPAIKANRRFGFRCVVAQTLTVTSNEGSNMVVNGNATASSVTISITGQQIGRGFVVEATADGLSWVVTDLSGNGTPGSAGNDTVTVNTIAAGSSGAVTFSGEAVFNAGQSVGASNVQSKTANYPVLVTDSGTYFDNTGASGSVTFTLPAVASSKGVWVKIFSVVDQVVVVTAPAGTLVGPNNAAKTSFTTGATGNRIGVAIEAYCNGANWFLFVDAKGLTMAGYT